MFKVVDLAYNTAENDLDFTRIKYDDFGRLNNWWTKNDANEFKKIQNDEIITLYKLSNQIVSKSLNDLSYKEHQLFIHNNTE